MKKALLVAAIAATASMPSLASDTYFALELGAGQYDYSGKASNSKTAKEIDFFDQELKKRINNADKPNDKKVISNKALRKLPKKNSEKKSNK